jgi:hypothetical protein
MRNNRDSIAHLPMVFMAKIYQMFMHLANFSQNSLNMNKVELGNSDFDTRLVKTGVRLGAKFINKMIEHVEDNLAPKENPNFAKSIFVEQLQEESSLSRQPTTMQRIKKAPSSQEPSSQEPPSQEKATSANPTEMNQERKNQGRSFLTRA